MNHKKEAIEQWEWMKDYLEKNMIEKPDYKYNIYELKCIWFDEHQDETSAIISYRHHYCFACVEVANDCKRCPVRWATEPYKCNACQKRGPYADVELDCTLENIQAVIDVMKDTWNNK